MVNGKWQMERGGWSFFDFFSFSRNGIFIFGGFELGLEKMLGMQMIGVARLAGVIMHSERKRNAKPQAARL